MKAYMSLTRLYNDHLSESKAKIAALWFDEVMIYSFSNSFFPKYLMEVYGIYKGHENLVRSILLILMMTFLVIIEGKKSYITDLEILLARFIFG